MLQRPARDRTREMGDTQDDSTVVVMDEGDTPPTTAAAEKEKSTTTMFLYKAWNDAYDEHSSLNDCMIMDEVADKDRIINSYMISNNPSPFTNSYYPQYHVVEFIVFNVKAKKAFECIKTYLTHNRKLESKYSRHYGFRLTKRRTCVNSYSTSIELIFTYPRKHQQQYSDSPLLTDELKATAAKKQTSVYSFMQASGLSEKCRTDWSDFITACKPYEYVNKAEFIKLLNTHCGGCFTSTQEYPRFCAFVEEWKGYCSEGESTDTAAADDDESTTTTRRGDDDDIRSRRSFAPPHPSIGLRRTGSSSDAAAGEKASVDSSVRPSSTAAAEAGGENQAGVVIDEANDGTAAKRRNHKYYLTTGFMQHSICGLHKQTTVARDIHRNTNTLMFHKRDYDSRGHRDIVHSHDYMMSHNPGKDPFAEKNPKQRAPKQVSPQKRKKKNDSNSAKTKRAKSSSKSKTTKKESSSSSNEDTSSSSNNTDNEEY